MGSLKINQNLVTAENAKETLANWQEFVVNYDYEKFWTDTFWWAWNTAHPAQTP